MNLFQLVWRNVLHRRTLSVLTAAAVAVTVALTVFLLLLRDGVEQGAEKGYGPFEVVVGADGSESQLALNTFYHVGAPTGNVPYSVLTGIQSEAETAAAFGMTTGDSYNGYPIVGVDPGYFRIRYGDKHLASGKLYAQTGEAVVGAYAAKAAGLKVGDTFHGAHGLTEEHHEEEEEEEHEAHESFSYKVVGILPQLHTPDDRAVFTTLDYAWAVHHNEHSENREVTAVMIKPATLTGAQALKLKYDALDNVQAVFTSKAVADVVNMADKGTQAAGALTVLCVALASITLTLSLIAAANERRRDAGLLRLIGKSRSYVWATLMGEGLLLTLAGLAAGVLLGHGISGMFTDAVFGYTGIRLSAWASAPGEGLLLAGALVLGGLATLAPAMNMYRADPLQLFRG
jgi:putative ABC transport system permease protein